VPQPGRPNGRHTTACGHRLDQANDPPPGTDALARLLPLQQRNLDRLNPTGPGHTSTFGRTAETSRYFIDLRLLANLICATRPAARPLAATPNLAARLDEHVTDQHALISHMVRNNGRIHRHAIHDRPPAASATCAGFMIADRILTRDAHNLDELFTDVPVAQRWALHFLRAEPYCSPGLVAAAAPHVKTFRRKQPTRIWHHR
jgi:hypothetical protein